MQCPLKYLESVMQKLALGELAHAFVVGTLVKIPKSI
jgi:hypothetical protein